MYISYSYNHIMGLPDLEKMRFIHYVKPPSIFIFNNLKNLKS